MNEDVEDFVRYLDDDKKVIVSNLRKLASSVSGGATEAIKYAGICFFKGKRAFVGIMPRKKHVSVIFDRSNELEDPEGNLEGTGKIMKHIKIYNENDIEDKNVLFYIQQSFLL